ncbi:MAG: hypothetical protein ACI8PZ_007457 [Myxococcota bacterium]
MGLARLVSTGPDRWLWCAAGVVLVALGCSDPGKQRLPADPDPTVTDDTHAPTVDTASAPIEVVTETRVMVTLDGEPVEGATVLQGGVLGRVQTDAAGMATLPVDWTVVGGDVMAIAAHPEARSMATEIRGPEVSVALTRYTPDNPEYRFGDPGEPTRQESTDQCMHCHLKVGGAWFESPHRTAASNPVLHDLYAGTASLDAGACADAGGEWASGRLPGGGNGDRCWLGDGVLPQLNGCDGPECDAPDATGGCADCHAPGIDGAVLGDRDLLDATGFAHDYGVHCDVCHKVESVDLEAPGWGVAGPLRVHRPSEPDVARDWVALSFGPFDDVPTRAMGGVARDHYTDGTLCAGCHEQHQPALVPGGRLDPVRWPDGTLPIHTTWSEAQAGPLGADVPCTACHMPPDPDVGNAADLYYAIELDPGLVAGWERPAGHVREHSWVGPRQPASGMLELAASLSVDATVSEGTLAVTVTTANVGPAHAIPTGEPLRSLVLRVSAACDAPLVATGGDAGPDIGGHRGVQDAGADWLSWPGAAIGDVVRVVRRDGWHDYLGYGPFGDGRFDAEAKGLPRERVVGQAVVVAVDGDRVSLDGPLPEGDRAYLGDADDVAGAAGFAFARVLTGVDGRRMVPHFLAVDVASDNRLLPGQSWLSTHTFDSPCASPVVTATLVHRAYPAALARERGWAVREAPMASVEVRP